MSAIPLQRRYSRHRRKSDSGHFQTHAPQQELHRFTKINMSRVGELWVHLRVIFGGASFAKTFEYLDG